MFDFTTYIVFGQDVVQPDQKRNFYEVTFFNSVIIVLHFQMKYEPGLIFEPLEVFSIERVSVFKTICEHQFSR